MGTLTDVRVFGIQMRSAFQRDVAWVKNAGYTLGASVGQGARHGVAYFRDAVVNLKGNLNLIDDHFLQKNVATQWASEFAQDLYREEIQSRADVVARDCIVSKTSTLQCVGTSALSVGGLGLSAFSPITHAKAACNSYVTMLLKNEALTPAEADEWRYRINTTFLANDIFKLHKLMKDMGGTLAALQKAKRTLEGRIDKRFKVYKDAIKTRMEGVEEVVGMIGDAFEEENQKTQ